MSLTLSVCILLAFVTFVFARLLSKKPNHYKSIPGPPGFPIVGHLPLLGITWHLKFGEWAEKYGDIYQIRLGNQKTVIVSDPKLAKQMFNDVNFCGRQLFPGYEMYKNESLGIANIEGDMWEEHRRFLVKQLREFGFGKRSMEELIMEEVKETIDRLNKMKDSVIRSPKAIFQIAVVNSLWMMIGNHRFHHDDNKINSLLADISDQLDQFLNLIIIFFLPWTTYIVGKPKHFETVMERIRNLYAEMVENHKRTFDENSPRDFVDVYLKKMKTEQNNRDSKFYGDKAERQLINLVYDLFLAGTDTTSSTISFAILYLIHLKNIQGRLQDEIGKVTKNTRRVCLDDRPNMPYTNAVIEETFRMSSVLGPGVPHRALKGKEFCGYFIEKGTYIWPNMYHVHHSVAKWGDPENFRPERFLSEDFKTFIKNDNVFPFQVGKRQCPGEPLARDSVFLFLTNIFQEFNVSLASGSQTLDLIPIPGFFFAPKDYAIEIVKREF